MSIVFSRSSIICSHHLLSIMSHDQVFIDPTQIWQLLSENTPAYTLIATQTPPHDPNSRASAPDFTAIVLNLIRLERESTDILVTINVPHIKGEYSADDVDLQLGKQGKLIENAVEHAAKIWETFKIKDWGLFDEV